MSEALLEGYDGQSISLATAELNAFMEPPA